MTVAIFAGSFDPFTNGHRDVLQRAFIIADKVVVAIGVHPSKAPLFTFEERKTLISSVIKDVLKVTGDRFEVVAFDNLLVDKAREIGASLIIRGLRDETDFNYEMQLAGMNAAMAPDIQTVFFPAKDSVRSISATLVRQITSMGGDVSPFVPEVVAHALTRKLKS
ncbi:pantetheine-phosphate adenylyltransferase [uncultured Bartonella sp.]|uniref:pantetheine-phosphate adenylyltransferase n=1 Tax=uncultured Bartonella sp. TaxID=104108 RepID=UPI0025CF6F4F|nr:pantetheine-phosphate adenylyltransferase [uncultured Bartonella sp.]